jgi:argininosuccinate synthase
MARDRNHTVKKCVLAYSGGLDTSVILRWLQEEYRCEVVTFTADLGQGEELAPAKAKAERMGAAAIYVEDLRETFVKDYVFPMFRANALYEGTYLLGTSIARPLIAKRQIEIARETGADAVAHGATGKGNDQVRFEMGPELAYRLDEICTRAPDPDPGHGVGWRAAVFDRCEPAPHFLRGPRAGGPLGRP